MPNVGFRERADGPNLLANQGETAGRAGRSSSVWSAGDASLAGVVSSPLLHLLRRHPPPPTPSKDTASSLLLILKTTTISESLLSSSPLLSRPSCGSTPSPAPLFTPPSSSNVQHPRSPLAHYLQFSHASELSLSSGSLGSASLRLQAVLGPTGSSEGELELNTDQAQL